MSVDLTPVITATTHWLVHAYPASGGALSTVLAETQARQAVTLAAWLRYPTSVDAELVDLSGPGGTARLDGLVGTEALTAQDTAEEPAWRSWVDEVVASWATCLLAAPALARTASARATAGREGPPSGPTDFRRLTDPDPHDLAATPLLRHPDLTAPIAELHRAELLVLLDPDDDDLPESVSAPLA